MGTLWYSWITSFPSCVSYPTGSGVSGLERNCWKHGQMDVWAWICWKRYVASMIENTEKMVHILLYYLGLQFLMTGRARAALFQECILSVSGDRFHSELKSLIRWSLSAVLVRWIWKYIWKHFSVLSVCLEIILLRENYENVKHLRTQLIWLKNMNSNRK